MSATEQFTNEIESVIKRYAYESDISVAEVVGCLESVKFRFLLDTFNPPEPAPF